MAGGSTLAEVVDGVAAAVASGRSVGAGLAAAAAAAEAGLRDELAWVVATIDRGVAVTTAVDRWAAASDVPGAPLVAAALGLADESGGDVDSALAGVAETLRERRSLDREIRALSSQARMSAAVIAVAPLGFAVIAAGSDRATAGFLLASPGGWGCLAAGLALDAVGWRWMRRITGSVR